MRHLGRYRLDAVEGVGAFSTVWRGYDTELDIRVAVKVLAENWSLNADVRERFLAEARLLRRIHDPQVVRVHDIGVDDDRPFFVMDFVPGGTLEDQVRARVPGAEALRLAAEAARAIQVLHDEGVLHRDVKPSNLLLDEKGRVLVADLGSAKRLAEATGITVTTGTPAYMAPEQARGEPVDARCDVYSLGAVAYELISGRLPYDGSDSSALLERPSDSRPAPLARAHDLPKAVDRVLSSALATMPLHRPASAEALADALERAAVGSPVRDVRRVRREVPPAFVLVLAVILFAASAVVTWYVLR